MKLMLLIALFFLQNSYAFERYFYQSSQGQHIIVTYPESGKWVLEEFLVKPGKLQEKIVSKFFSSEKNLLKHKDSFYKKTNFQKDIRTHYFNSSEVTNSSIWKVTEHWDLNWEKKYSQWVDSEFDKNFFVKYNVATDCADVAFALRWIFSRINGLPAANTLAGSHIIFSHESLKKEWQSLPTHTEWHKDLRFLAGLNYLLSNAFTGTLNIDGYPIEITTDAFNVGTIHLLGGHTQIISKIDTSGDTAPIWKLSSTVPMKVRVLFEELMLDQTPTAQAYGGLFHMRWPSKESGTWKLIAKEKMPYYSIEQYGSDFIGNSGSFTLAIIDRLNIPFNPKAVIKNAATTLVEMIKSRVDIVRDGHKYCSAADCREGSFNYEEYSTPTRDGRIKNQFSTIDDLIAKFTSMDPNLASFWTQFQKTTMILIEGASKSLAAYRMIFERKLASYHPDDSINERWALDRNASFSAFNKKMNRIISKREGLVLSGKACVNNQSCAQGSQLWEEHNTYVFDQELRDSGYATFFYLKKMYGDSTLKSYLSEELIKTLYSIPKMISEPTVSLIKRRGMHHVDMFHLGLISKRLIEINFDTYIIDNTIINLAMNSKIYSGLGSYVLLDDTHQQVISLKNSKVTLIDAVDGVEFDSVRVQDNVNRINWLGDSVFGVSDCQSNMTDPNQTVKCSLMLYKVAQKKITQLMVLNDIDPFSVLNFTQNYKMSGFHQGVFVDLTSNQSIYISNGNIHQIPLADEEYQLNYSAVSATNKTFHILEFRSKVNNKISKNIFINKKTDEKCTLVLDENYRMNRVLDSGIFLTMKFETNSYQVKEIQHDCSITHIQDITSNWVNLEQVGETTYLSVQSESTQRGMAYYQGALVNIFDQGFYFTAKEENKAYLIKEGNFENNIEAYVYDFGSRTISSFNYFDIVYNCNKDFLSYTCDSFKGLKFKQYGFFVDNISHLYYRFLDSANEIYLTKYKKTSFGSVLSSQFGVDYLKQEIKDVQTHSLYSPGVDAFVLVKSNSIAR